jgi:4-hydroxy-tetrahydrodipicolinate synthase
MNTQSIFKGTGVATITPFRKDDSIDFKAYERHIKRLIDNGVDYIVAMGTTSEVSTYTSDEELAVVEFILEVVDSKVPVVVGLGGNNTRKVALQFKRFDFSRIAAILSVAPYYNKPTQKGIYEHYKYLASEAPKPLILYNVPSRTSVNIDAETCIKLASEFENIIAVKEASGNLMQVSKILASKPAHFNVISGDDLLTLPIIALGGIGVISVVGNALPLQFSTMVRSALNGNFNQASELHLKLTEFIEAIFAENNPGGIKAALKVLDVVQNNLRLPLTRVSKVNYQQIERILKDSNWI